MNVKIRLTRKPLTTALWGVLVAAMAVLLTVGAAMMYSSGSLAGILDQYHTSIAVRTDRAHWEEEVEWSNGEVMPMMVFADKTFTEEDAAYFESLECVEEVYFHTLTAAYSPELIPAINPGKLHDSNSVYAGVMLVGELTEITAVIDYAEVYEWLDHQNVSIYGVLRLEEMTAHHSGHTRITEELPEYLNIELTVPRDYLDELQPGCRYVLVGSYNSEAHGLMLSDVGLHIEARYPWFVGNLSYSDTAMLDGIPVGVETYDGDTPIYGAPYIKPIEGTLEDFLADPANAGFVQAMDRLDRQNHGFVVLGTENVNALHAFVSNRASVSDGRAFTAEEHASGARVCMISETVAKNSGIQVGDTITMEQYLCQNTELDLNLNPSLDMMPFDGMQNNPEISKFSIHTQYGPAEEFTVVGIYRQSGEWADNSYSFTPNTILIPKGAQMEGAYGGSSVVYNTISKTDIYGETATVTEYSCEGTYGIYFSIKLKNGQVSDFEELMAADERFSGEFLTVDQGFGEVMESLEAISASTARLTAMVAAGWVLLLLLYVLLYQGSQRRNIGIMRSLGASPKYAADFLWRSGMAVAAIGVAVGTAVSWAVMGAVQTKLMDSAISLIPSGYSSAALSDEAVQLMAAQSQLPLWAMLLLTLAQLVIFALALRLHAGRTAAKNPRALLR